AGRVARGRRAAAADARAAAGVAAGVLAAAGPGRAVVDPDDPVGPAPPRGPGLGAGGAAGAGGDATGRAHAWPGGADRLRLRAGGGGAVPPDPGAVGVARTFAAQGGVPVELHAPQGDRLVAVAQRGPPARRAVHGGRAAGRQQ